MKRLASGLLPAALAVGTLFTGCQWLTRSRAARKAPVEILAPSPRLIVGRIIAVDAERRFAFVELAPDAPATALVDGTEMSARTPELRATGKLRASRYVRGPTLGTTIIEGQPTPGDEVVWLAP